MATKCKWINGNQVFYDNAMHISTGGNVTSNQQIVSDGDEIVLVTDTIYANTLNSTSCGFRVVAKGEISASAGTESIVMTLRYGTTDIVAVTTGALVDEDDKPFELEFTGHVLTTGATGKIVATGLMYIFQTTPLTYMTDTANTGQTVDLTADGSFNITGDWSAADSDADIIVTHGWVEYFR